MFSVGMGCLKKIELESNGHHKEDSFMACFVCKAGAESIEPAGGDYEERSCDSCGHYRVSGTLLAEISAQHLEFDIEATRRWIAINKVANPIPTMSSFDAKQHHLLRL